MSNPSELKKRVTTGVIGGAILLSVLLFGGKIGAAILGFVLSLGMLNEFIDITFSLPDKKHKKILLFGLLWLIGFTNFWIPRIEYILFLFYFFVLFGYFLFTADENEDETALKIHFQELMFSLFGGVYLVFLPLYLVLIRDSKNGREWIMFFFLLNWVMDSASYFVGKKYGKKRLYFKISPKKTVEGAWGGLGFGLFFTLLFKFLFFHSLAWVAVVLIPLGVGTMAQIGDLCESFLKRAYQKKDSGDILPGHGGFLDRFDGIVFSLPLMYACIRLLG